MPPPISPQGFSSRRRGYRRPQSKHTALAQGGLGHSESQSWRAGGARDPPPVPPSPPAAGKGGSCKAQGLPILRQHRGPPRGAGRGEGGQGEAEDQGQHPPPMVRPVLGSPRVWWGELAAAAADQQFLCVGGRGWSDARGSGGARSSCSALGRLAHLDLAGTGEAEVVFFPRWQSRRAGRAGGTQSLLLPSLAPSWGHCWKRARRFLPSCASSSSGPAPLPHAQPAREEALRPRLWCQSARVRVHACSPASPRQATALGREVGQLRVQRQRRQGRVAAFTGRAHKSWVQGSGKRAGRPRQRRSHRAGISPLGPREGRRSGAEMLQVRHRTAGPGMRLETSTQERPRSLRKSTWEHWLNGNGEGWSPRSPGGCCRHPQQQVLSAETQHRVR